MRYMPSIVTVSSIVLGLGIGAAQAQTASGGADAPPRMPISQANVDQKAKFVTNLVTNSASARAIEASGDAAALDALKTARVLVEEATKGSAGGNPTDADVKLNKALEMVMSHTRRISEGSVRGGRAVQLYESRAASVKALLDAFDRVAKEKGALSRVADRRAAIATILAETDAMAKAGDYEAAIVQLDKAYTRITTEVSSLRDGDKLTKELSFASAEEEYVYEIDRNDSHIFLLKLTLKEKPPHPNYEAQIEATRVEAQDLRKEAEAKAKDKDYAPAIKLLGTSTDKLIRALRMAGAYIPG